MKQLKFSNGDIIDVIGLGTWKAKDNDVKKAVGEALRIGYRHIDTAAIYKNEKEIGEALKEAFDEGILNRKELHITSKLWNNAHKPEDVEPAVRKTLKDLQLDYLDLYLIHWPVVLKSNIEYGEKADDYLSLEEVPIIDTWKAILKLKEKGLVKHVGVSNFSKEKLEDLLSKTDQKPEVNQIENHIYLQQDKLVDFCKKKDILITCYSPLGSSDRSNQMKRENEPSLMADEAIKEIAFSHNVSEAQIILAFQINRGLTAIPKSTDKDHLKNNYEAAEINLSREDMEKIEKLDRHYRFIPTNVFHVKGNSYQDVYNEKHETVSAE